jgi:hypothetical protein
METGVHPDFSLGGADPEAIYNLRLILKFCHKNHFVSTT